jgi:hypothetical protein
MGKGRILIMLVGDFVEDLRIEKWKSLIYKIVNIIV